MRKNSVAKRLAMLEKAPYSRQRQTSATNLKMARGMNAVCNRMVGTEDVMTITKDEEVDTLVLDYEGLQGTRIVDFFDKYEYWFVHNLRFEFVPSTSLSTGGTIHVAPEWDPMDLTPSGDSLVKDMSASLGYKSGRISSPLIINMPNKKKPDGSFIKPCLFTGPLAELRLSSYGKVFLYVEGCNSTASTVGRLKMHYDIEFCMPQMSVKPAPFVPFTGVTAPAIKSVDANTRSAIYRDEQKARDTAGGSAALGIQLLDSGVAKHFGVDEILSFVIGDTDTGTLDIGDMAGRLITAGTRLYARAPNKILNLDTDDVSIIATTSLFDEISTSPLFEPAATLTRQGTSGAIKNISDLTIMSLGSLLR